MSPSGELTVIHSFRKSVDGAAPLAPLLQASNGNLYGTASALGFGIGSVANGTAFQMALDGTIPVPTSLWEISTRSPLQAPFIQATDGLLYFAFWSTPNGAQIESTRLDLSFGVRGFSVPVVGGLGTDAHPGIMGPLVQGTDGAI